MDFDRIGMRLADELEVVTPDMLRGDEDVKPLLPKPCPEEMDKALAIWEKTEPASSYEKAMVKLFEVLPDNGDIADVLPKVAVINEFCSQNIRAVGRVAQHIVSLNIDERLEKGDLGLVDDIANVRMPGGRIWNFYSFATKYLSHAKPDVFPEYDNLIQKVLAYYRDKDDFSRFLIKELKDYPRYAQIVRDFRRRYGLDDHSLKDIYKFLWIEGRRHFREQKEKDS